MLGDVNVMFIALPLQFDRKSRKASFVEEKSVKSPEVPLRSPAAWSRPGEFNAMKNCARCNGKLATMQGEVRMRFITFPLPFDRRQSLVCGGKVGQVT